MRIISGRLGGRNFSPPHGHRTHPMSEKIRGALFNSLGDINGLTVLDAFAGSGALAFEAVSRGATGAVAIDLDAAAHRIITENALVLGISDAVSATRAAASSWSRRHQKELFDLIFLDPPYDGVEPKMLLTLAETHSKPGSIIIISLPPNSAFELPVSDFELLSSKSYGDAKTALYRRNGKVL